MRSLAASLALLGACGGDADGDLPAGSAPNVLVIIADDLGYGDVGCYGSPDALTPHLDRLAEQGVRLTDFYVASPLCSSSRASFVTGRYPSKHGLRKAIGPGRANYGLNLHETLLSQLLDNRGYVTGIVGKWHLGVDGAYLPWRRGFDDFYGMLCASSRYYEHTYFGKHDLWRGKEHDYRDGEYSTDLFTEEAIAFIEDHKEQAWFLMLPYNAPHLSNDQKTIPAPEEFMALFKDLRAPEQRRQFLAAVAAMDAGIGRVLDALDRHGLAEDTLVMFFSDNGPLPPYGSSAPYRGGKDEIDEGGIHVPGILRWPSQLTPDVSAEPVIAMDFFATAAAAAGAKVPKRLEVDGVDLVPFLRGEADPPHEALFWDHAAAFTSPTGELLSEEHDRVMRMGRWRLTRTKDGVVSLHDLVDDPAQLRDLAADKPELVADMTARLDAFLQEMRDARERDRRRRSRY